MIVRADRASSHCKRHSYGERNMTETRWFHIPHVASFRKVVKQLERLNTSTKKLVSFLNCFIHANTMKADEGSRRTAARRSGSAEAAKVMLLIEAAESVFLAKGYHSATMDDVAQAAGMSKKTIYQLIRSKADLFIALLDHYQTRLVLPTPQPDWSEQRILVEHLLALAQFLLSPEQLAIIRLIMAEYTHSPDFSRVFHQSRFKKAKSRLESCLSDIAARRNAQYRDLGEMSAMLFGMTIGEFHLSVLVGFRTPPSKALLERRIHLGVSMFLAGSACALEPLEASPA
jgi:TetR/AcrR family transcriptional regulator, mexJK operon transcriptional repressor